MHRSRGVRPFVGLVCLVWLVWTGLGCSRPPAPAQVSPPPSATLERRSFTVAADDGHALAVHSIDPGTAASGPATILIHGRTWSTVPDFDPPGPAASLMRDLAAQGVTVYGVDLRGYGATDRDASGWLTPERAADDVERVAAWIAERHGAAPHVLGWSMGSYVAHLAALRHPGAVDRVILYAYPGGLGARARFAASTNPAEPERRATTEAAARSDFITPEVITEEEIAAFVASALESDPMRCDWNELGQFTALDPGGLQRPTLVIHGALDPLVPGEAGAAFAEALPDGRLVVIEGADHAAHLEHPERFVAEVVAFLGADAQ